MSEFCFWILNDGIIVKPDSRHILAVASAPDAFGETEESLNETFGKYGQSRKSNFEGKARAEVLMRVIRRNNIRIRKNQHKRSQHWSIQLNRLDNERRSAIAAWAKHIIPTADDKYGDVIIHEFHDESKDRTSLNRLAGEYDKKFEPEVIGQGELKRRYT